MDAKQAIKMSLDSGDMVGLMYLEDLTDKEMMARPCPGCNHINWQVGHLITAEHNMIEKVLPGSMPELPAGFKEKYAKETATSDDPNAFVKKDELISLHKKVRAATVAALDKIPDSKLDDSTGMDFVPTIGGLFALNGGHWMMHAGQWAVVRRQHGRKPLF
jgi:DinB superfamily